MIPGENGDGKTGDARLRRIMCVNCREEVPARMDRLLSHARHHRVSVAECFPLSWSREAAEAIRSLPDQQLELGQEPGPAAGPTRVDPSA